MTNPPADAQLTEAVERMTRWEGGTGDVWRGALSEAEYATARPRNAIFYRRYARPALLLVASLMLLTAIGYAVLPDIQRARRTDAIAGRATPSWVAADPGGVVLTEHVNMLMTDAPARAGDLFRRADSPFAARGSATLQIQRFIRRTATLELRVENVSTALARVSSLIDESRGEFVQDSSLSGPADAMTATLALRVEAGRLAAVLAAARDMGEVVSESTRSDDVTAQFVDLDARIRNERRVEVELLELLGSRPEAPLKDIMEVRQSLASVRETIERLEAQSEGLRSIVDLATVRVTLFGDLAPLRPTDSGLGALLSQAWRDGLSALTASFAAMVRIIVGGVLGWLLLLLAGAVTWRIVRSRRRI